MINSIRRYILIYLGLSISTILMLLILISNYYFDRRAISQHLDAIMLISAFHLNASINKLNHAELINLQQTLNQTQSSCQFIDLPRFCVQKYIQNFNLQILDEQGQNIVNPNQIPKLPKNIIQTTGFHSFNLDHENWQFLIQKHPRLHIYIVLGEKTKFRNQLIQQITQDDFYLLLAILPISLFLITFIVDRSLAPLQQITAEIKKRNPHHLNPVDLKQCPLEINPLIDEINHLLERLKEALGREQNFAADAAHELRTPLSIIKTLSQTGLEMEEKEEIKQILQKIIHNVDRGTHVIQQLMSMSKTTAETVDHNKFVTLDLGQICREILSNMTTLALKKNMDLELEVCKPCPKIQANKIALEILIQNLIDNAIRYSYENTSIFVKVYPLEAQVVLEIRDQGPGIPKSKQAKVFDRFYRAHPPKYQGSGLGLAIVKQIVNLHQAEISIENTPKSHGLITRIFFPQHLANCLKANLIKV